MTTFAMAVGVGTQNAQGEWLEVFFPEPQLNPSESEFQKLAKALGYKGGNQAVALTPLKRTVIRHGRVLVRDGVPAQDLPLAV